MIIIMTGNSKGGEWSTEPETVWWVCTALSHSRNGYVFFTIIKKLVDSKKVLSICLKSYKEKIGTDAFWIGLSWLAYV